MTRDAPLAACTAAFAIILLTGGPAQGQQVEADRIIPIEDWEEHMAAMYADAWSAERLVDDAEVISAETGEDIGNVENILIGPDGEIRGLIAEVGGFWDIGDTHVSIPWDQVELAEDFGSVVVPITEETVEDYGLFGDYGVYDGEAELVTAETAAEEPEVVAEDLATGPQVWKASDLIDDYAMLADRTGYGYVDDLIFNTAGELQAVIVEPDIGTGVRGRYARPWYGYPYGWAPGRPYYTLPYVEGEVAGLESFQYERLGQAQATAEEQAGLEEEADSQ